MVLYFFYTVCTHTQSESEREKLREVYIVLATMFLLFFYQVCTRTEGDRKRERERERYWQP